MQSQSMLMSIKSNYFADTAFLDTALLPSRNPFLKRRDIVFM
jgi:hypothetical protein